MIVEHDLAEFVVLHRTHGRLVAELRRSAAARPRLAVACPCGVIFERRLRGDEPFDDLAGALARAQRTRADGERRAA